MVEPQVYDRFVDGGERVPLPCAETLPDGPNLHWVEPWRGRLATARGNAEVRVGSDWVRMAIHGSTTSPAGALRANAYLPANLRYSGPARKASLLADTWIAPESFQAAIQEFRVGVRSARPRTRPWTQPTSEASEAHSVLMEKMTAFEAGVDMVSLERGWELGVAIRGRRVPVRVTPESDGLRLHRIILGASRLECGSCVEAALHDAALRLNSRIRFARFALHDSGLTVEARLSDRLIDEAKLVESAHAIAVVSHEFEPELGLLSRHADVARCYARIFQPEAQEHAA
jgi:hypothetical protein